MHRELAAISPVRYRPDLASTRYNLSAVLSELDRPTEALQATEKGLAMSRELAAADPNTGPASRGHWSSSVCTCPR
jgi:hypothetical protein